MEEIILQAEIRELLGKRVKNLRTSHQLPAVLYGRNFKSMPLTIDKKEFTKVASAAGEATLIDLKIKGAEEAKILIRDIQRQPVSDEILHVDFYKVDMTKVIETEIPLSFEGAALAVTDLEGNFVTNKDSIKVKCLPNKLVSEIKVDITPLKTFDDLIHISDLKVPEGIDVLEEPEDVVAQVTPPRSEEEMAELEAEGATAAETEKAQIEGIEAEAEAEKAEKAATEGEEAPPEKAAQSEEKTK